MSTPPRLDQPVKYLTAPLPVIEASLTARADHLAETGAGLRDSEPEVSRVLLLLAAEFRDLAVELHHYR